MKCNSQNCSLENFARGHQTGEWVKGGYRQGSSTSAHMNVCEFRSPFRISSSDIAVCVAAYTFMFRHSQSFKRARTHEPLQMGQWLVAVLLGLRTDFMC